MDLGLSILIPVYNWDVHTFVSELHKQALELGIAFEILVYNDASTQEINTNFSTLKFVNYVCLHNNIGRARIRNRLAKDSKYSKLLFLDGDSYPKHTSFLENYWNAEFEEKTILCGGTAYQKLKSEEKPSLRWVYGKAREENTSGKKGFASNNFLIHKRAFLEVQFDERIQGYGHEDTLFGLDCKRKGYVFYSCNSPLLHLGLESDKQFLEKTKAGVGNLKKLYLDKKISAKDSKLIAFHESLKFKFFVKLVCIPSLYLIKRLVIKHYNLKAFDLLKWYWFSKA